MVLSSHMIKMPSDWRRIMRRMAMVIILGSFLLMGGSASAAPKKEKGDTKGGYKLIFKGCYRGTGTAVVTDAFVSIKGKDLTDEEGNRVDFDAKKLPLENNRFRERL